MVSLATKIVLGAGLAAAGIAGVYLLLKSTPLGDVAGAAADIGSSASEVIGETAGAIEQTADWTGDIWSWWCNVWQADCKAANDD